MKNIFWYFDWGPIKYQYLRILPNAIVNSVKKLKSNMEKIKVLIQLLIKNKCLKAGISWYVNICKSWGWYIPDLKGNGRLNFFGYPALLLKRLPADRYYALNVTSHILQNCSQPRKCFTSVWGTTQCFTQTCKTQRFSMGISISTKYIFI